MLGRPLLAAPIAHGQPRITPTRDGALALPGSDYTPGRVLVPVTPAISGT